MPFSPKDETAVNRVVDLLRPDQRILFITGAGLSADSGLPTYRGIGGLYEDGLPVHDNWPIEEILSGAMMEVRPDLTWKYLAEIARASQGATFNRGHQVIAEMEPRFAAVWTLTQNVDGFHRLAGSRNVIDIHGDLHFLICTRSRCDWHAQLESFEPQTLPPRCPLCNAVVRPDVVLFGEALPYDKMSTLRRELVRGFDVVFSVGTSSLFPYILEPVLSAHEAGIPTIEINPGRTDLSDVVDIKITARAAESLDAIWTRYQNR